MTRDHTTQKWILENDLGDIEQSEYRFWSDIPTFQRCAVMLGASDLLKVFPSDCEGLRYGLCEKKGEGMLIYYLIKFTYS